MDLVRSQKKALTTAQCPSLSKTLPILFLLVAHLDLLASDNSLKETALRIHNEHRKNAGLQPLQWDDALAQSATQYSQELGRITNCKMALPHSKGRKNTGENLYYVGAGSLEPGIIAEKGCNKWYKETATYLYPSTKCDMKFNHMTQMMWANSKKIGSTKFGSHLFSRRFTSEKCPTITVASFFVVCV